MTINNNPRILFIIPDQFGYSAGYFFYCKHLLERGFTLGVLSVDFKKPKISLNGNIKISYVTPKNKFQYRLEILRQSIKLKYEYDIVVIKYTFGVSILNIFLDKKATFLDIRTGSVRKSALLRIIENIIINFESKMFTKVFIISIGLANQLHISSKKYILLPLGSEEHSKKNKTYDSEMNFMYIGTLSNRNLHIFISGFAKFVDKYRNLIPITLNIIGTGNKNDLEIINSYILKNKLDDIIFLRGEIIHNETVHYFNNANYGVSFIPMKKHYQFQPPTKTFEYVINGLFCIATNTYANKEIIKETNGVLHDDNENSTFEALQYVYLNRKTYSTNSIKSTLSSFKWSNIVENVLVKNFNQVIINE